MDSIVFFGSGPVAAQSLELLQEHFEIEAVVTKPRPAHHHGVFPVLALSERLNLKVFTVSNKDELSELIESKPFKSNAAVLIDFGIIVAQDTIDYFPKGIINSHFSLLPELRGADPITFAILSRQKQTGVSLMLLVEAMDEGPLLAQGMYDIKPQETSITLTDELIKLSDSLLRDILPGYLHNELPVGGNALVYARTQEEVMKMIDKPFMPTYSRKLKKEDGRIDWSKPADVIEREIRAYSEWPKSYGSVAGTEVIICRAHLRKTEMTSDHTTTVKAIGTSYYVKENNELCVQSGDSSVLIIDSLKPSGKTEMTAAAFRAGYGKALLSE
jgi:methionyl-tRNA formyltransferase